jgi:membrane protease YdiL (CAAX protease family)
VTARVALLLLGFLAAVLLRVVVGGDDVARSEPAGLVFAGLLVVGALVCRTRLPLTRRAVLLGLAGVVVLCVPVLLSWTPRPPTVHGFARWAAVVTVVAVAEEWFLRGALYDAVREVAGDNLAIAVGALAFGLLHLPLYGWGAVPLDVAVGVLLGELRRVSGTPAAPAVTHVGADLAAWFLR